MTEERIKELEAIYGQYEAEREYGVHGSLRVREILQLLSDSRAVQQRDAEIARLRAVTSIDGDFTDNPEIETLVRQKSCVVSALTSLNHQIADLAANERGE